MNISSSASTSAAQLALAKQDANVTLLKKVQDVTKAEGEAAVALIDQAAQSTVNTSTREGGLDIVA